MVGGCLRCLSRCCRFFYFTRSVVLLLGLCLHDVEASTREPTIHKKVGDTVEFTSNFQNSTSVTFTEWTYKAVSASTDKDITRCDQFKGRFHINPQNFSLTVRELTVQDSGVFSFVSEENDKQRPTVTVNLQVLEPIMTQPVLKSINSTWEDSNRSCTVLLECSSTPHSSVSYQWTVGGRTLNGPRLYHVFREEDGKTNFTCTVSNFISNSSAYKTIKCSSDVQKGEINFVQILSVAGGCCLLIVVVVGTVVGVCYCKQREAGIDSNDLTVYADISDIGFEDGIPPTMKPCSVYETIDNRVNPVTPAPHTVYDKIQLSRVRKASVSPYQEIS